MESGLVVLITLAALALGMLVLALAFKVSILGFRCKQVPRPGEDWVFIDKDADPWTKPRPVGVVDVRDGWVLYDEGFSKPARTKMDWFRRMYRPVSAEMDNCAIAGRP